MDFQDFLDLNKMFRDNPQYLRDVFRRAIFRSTFTGTWRRDRDGYYVGDYMHPDSRQVLEKHLTDPIAKEKLINGDWVDENGNVKTPIEYKINSEGFRSKQFEQGDRPIVCFGCSFTYGVGLPEEYTWPAIVSKHFNIPAYNLGLPGMGLDAATMYATNWLVDEIWRPRAICVLLPPPGRIDYFVDEEVTMPPPPMYRLGNLWHDISYNEEKPNQTTKQLIESIPFTSYMMQRRNWKTLKLLAHYLNIPFVYADTIYTDIHPKDFNVLQAEPLARDLMHAGLPWQQRTAKYLIDQLEAVPKSAHGGDWKELGEIP